MVRDPYILHPWLSSMVYSFLPGDIQDTNPLWWQNPNLDSHSDLFSNVIPFDTEAMEQSWILCPTRTKQNKFHQDSRKRTDGMDRARSWNSETRRSDTSRLWEPWILRMINVLSTGHVLAMQPAPQATGLGFWFWLLKAFISISLIIYTQFRKWAFHGPAKSPPTDLLLCRSWEMKRSSESMGSFS